MIPVSDLYLATLARSHRVTAAVSRYNPYDQGHEKLLLVTSGQITADAGGRARRSITFSLAREDAEDVALDVLGSRVAVWLGVDTGNQVEVVPGGVFRVNSIDRGNRSAINIQGTSFESYVVDDVYYKNIVYEKYAPLLLTIETIISEAFPEAQFEPYSDAVKAMDTPLPYDVIGERDRWEIIEKLSSLINCDVSCAPDGRFRVTPKPRISTGVPVAQLRQGEQGVLMSLSNRVDRADTYNAVLAMGQSSDPDVPPVSYHVADLDPTSPTYWFGPFGKKTLVFENALLMTKADCVEKAVMLLEEMRATIYNVDLTAVPNPAIEPNDLIAIDMLDGTVENYFVVQVVIPLGLGSWSATMATSRELPVILPPVEIPRTYEVLAMFEPDGVTVIYPNTYDGVRMDYANYSAVRYPQGV